MFWVKSGIASRKREDNLTPRVLFYHGVSEVSSPFVEGLHISPTTFRKQLIYIQKYHEPISLDEYYKRWSEHTFSGKEVVITFDDGYKNNLTTAAPLLKEFGFPFTVFISTQHIDSGKRFPTFISRAITMHPRLHGIDLPAIGIKERLSSGYQRKKISKKVIYQIKHIDIDTVNKATEQLINHLSEKEYQSLCDEYTADAPMTWEDVAILQKEYDCIIGSHCLDHFICDNFQKDSEVIKQISESKKNIEQKLGTPCHYLAYPNGHRNSIAINTAKNAEYRLAFTIEHKRVDDHFDPLNLPRYGVNFNFNSFVVDMTLKPK